MDNVPLWVWIWLAAEAGLGLLYVLLRSIKAGSSVYERPPDGPLPDGADLTAVEQDYQDRFPEARFE